MTVTRARNGRSPLTFNELLAANPGLQPVGFYHLHCAAHGIFRMLANGTVPETCPRCGQLARVARTRNLLCATRRPVPLVQRWRADNAERRPNTQPAWF